MDYITIQGARTNNLKNIDIKIPKGQLTVITGLSGSGKSSLAFDTIYAEGHRRYVENLSSYAKQVLGVLNKPDIDSADGLIPAIAIDQKTITQSPRSTVGTLTEVYDYLRLAFARAGVPKCPNCKKPLSKQERRVIFDSVKSILKNTLPQSDIKIIATLIHNDAEKKRIEEAVRKANTTKVVLLRHNGTIVERTKFNEEELYNDKAHTLEAVLHETILDEERKENTIRKILTQFDKALAYGGGRATLLVNKKEYSFSQNYTCSTCATVFPEITPKLFSFNSPHGACATCHGLGRKKYIEPNLVIPNQQLTLAEGAIRPWSRMANQTNWYEKTLSELAARHKFTVDTPIAQLTNEEKCYILYGDGTFEGVVNNLERRYTETNSEYLRSEIEKYMTEKICPLCNGKRLRQEALNVFIDNKNIADIADLSVEKLLRFLSSVKIEKEKKPITTPILDEIKSRLNNLGEVGLSYLSLSRQADSLAGGEAQRIRLATQLNGALSGILYVLDEPSIGLHPSDITMLIKTLNKLKQRGNTLIVVEHDGEIMKAADYIIDIGPLAGERGGKVVAQGTYNQLKQASSLTAQYLSGRKKIPVPQKRRPVSEKKAIKIEGAKAFNLKNITTSIPLDGLICITGVSGSGKSTLIYEILGKKVAQYFHRAQAKPGEHKQILGLNYLNKAINIDQSPIGRTPRSNLVTYTGIFSAIRTLFASQPEARLRGFSASHFSFNLKGGRCEACHGDGSIKIEMHFLPDVYVTCETCNGKRYNNDALEIYVRDKNIADVLSMTVDVAAQFFADEPSIVDKLKVLQAVGLGYVPLGQSATTLSGGEAQRIKLATELSRADTGRTLYILDEPTTGLHFEDVAMLLDVLQKLADKGNTVLIIEHNLDVIKSADWVIDVGPGGGDKGGKIVASGPPERVANVKESLTGNFIKKALTVK